MIYYKEKPFFYKKLVRVKKRVIPLRKLVFILCRIFMVKFRDFTEFIIILLRIRLGFLNILFYKK